MKSELDKDKLPQHVAFIMDGNGRWAKKHLLPRNAGHREGTITLKKITREAFSLGIKCVSLYAFSTENTVRPKEEVEGLINLLREHIKDLVSEFMREGVRINIMGDLDYFPSDLSEMLREIAETSKHLSKGILNLGLNYGSRAELVRAVNSAADRRIKVNEQSLASLLYTDGIPDPDIVVRTGGEKRLSNFMLYQAAYSELFFTDTLWPDFNKKELHAILKEYEGRSRRFGNV